MVIALLALLVLAGAAQAADRQGTVRPSDPFTWQGASATGASVNYDSASGQPCGKTPADYCDTTLLNVDVPADFWQRNGGGLQVSIGDYSPNPASDFDLYVYRSDASGRRGEFVKSSADVPGAEETTTIPDARGYYLVQVVYFAVTQSSYRGDAELVTRPRVPPDVDDPPGLQEHLASNPALGFRSHSEPHLARSPLNPNVLVAGSKMYNRDPDSLKEYEFKIGTYVSFDNGRSWRDLGLLDVCPASQAPPSSWPNNRCYPDEDPDKGGTGSEDVRDESDPDDVFDPRGSGDFGEEYIVSDVWVDFDDEGNAYAMVLDAPPFDSGNGWGMTFHRWETPSPRDLQPGGRTWSDRIPINKYDDPIRQQDFLDDKNTFAVNNAGRDRDGKTGTMIACWGQNISTLIKQQTVCERSTDGGRTWPGEPLPISDVQQLVIGVHVVADTRDPDTFYAVWLEYAQTFAGAPGTYRFTRTTNGGVTWEPSRPVATVNDIPRTFPGQSFRNLSIPIVAVGPKGEIYVTYAEYLDAPRPGDEDGKQADIRLIKSTDGGSSFSDPRTVNQDRTNADQFQQYVQVTPRGQVNVAYFDRRLDGSNFFIDQWLSRSNDGGRTFRDVRLSHDSWDPTINPPISGSGDFIGDYQGLVADDCNAIAFFNDTHLANDPRRDPSFDAGLPRSRFQEVFAWRVPNTAQLGGARPTGCPAGAGGAGKPGGQASGDFDRDGRLDLAIGAPGEDIGRDRDTGAAQVLYGSSDRASRRDQLFHQDGRGVPGRGEDGDRFGAALAAGDFDRDGFDDLVVGASREDVGRGTDAGAVTVFYGSARGLTASRARLLSQAAGAVAAAEDGDRFGDVLAIGDFDADGRDDLAAGAPGETIAGRRRAGALSVFPGLQGGLTGRGHRVLGQRSRGMPGKAESGDLLGDALAAGDFDGDGRDDLAAGAPSEDLGRRRGGGAVHVVPGGASGLRAGGELLSQNSPGVPGLVESRDGFGRRLAAGDIDGDKRGELAVGTPEENVGRRVDAGAVVVLPGSRSGLSGRGAAGVTQGGGVAGRAERHDRLGLAVAIGDFDGDGRGDLAAGAPGEDLARARGAGAVHVLRGSASGLSEAGDQLWHQNSPGVLGRAESGDALGTVLSSGDWDGSGHVDLALGAPGEDLGRRRAAGAVNLLYGSARGLTASGNLLLTQDSAGLSGRAESGDRFGG